MASSFLSKVHRTSNVRKVRAKINENKRKAKSLSKEYKRVVKLMSKRVAKHLKNKKLQSQKRKK